MVFEAFGELGRPATLSELARHLNIPVSSCLGLLRTLEGRRYVYAADGPRGAYYPTKRLLQVARSIADHDPISPAVNAAMERLRDESGETVVLAKLSGARVLYVDVVESYNSIRYVAQPGELRSLHASSNGRAMLAAMPAEQRAKLLRHIDYTRFTGKTLLTPEALEAAVASGAERGCYANFGESVEDLYAIARALRLDEKVYSLAVVGPSARLEERKGRHIDRLIEACAAIEATGAKP
jgi:DNA-binding IclR family transcriptional regulator